MPRYKLTIAYDGTDFHGWQKQEPPDPASDPALGPDRPRVKMRTVQEVVERAVREIVREPVEVKGSSRTDSGVHARAQVAAFTCSDGPGDSGGVPTAPEETMMPSADSPPEPRHGGWPLSRGTDRLLRAINSRLPDDCLITAIEPVAPEFDPILGCTSKAYSYTLHYSPRHLRPLWDRRYVHEIHTRPDVPAMIAAAKHFFGEHDFTAFAAAGHNRQTTIRTIYTCEVTERNLDDGSLRIRIDIAGSGFLWNMVRIIAGTLLEVGRGHFAPDDIARILEGRNRGLAGPTLPASGLCLEWISYDASIGRHEVHSPGN